MLKVNKTLIIIIFIFSVLPISTISADILKHDDFKYKEVNGSIEIIGYTGEESSNIIIPEQIDNQDVVSIGIAAFTELHSKKVEFPDTLKVIKEEAFELNNFKSVKFNDGLKKIDSGAFAGSFIEEITLPESVEEIEKDAFTENNIDIVYGYENSYAEEWSSNKGYDFEYLNHENNVDYEEVESIEQPLESDDKNKDEEDKNKVEEQSTENDDEDKNKVKEPSLESDDKDKTKDEEDKTIKETNKNKKITSKKYDYKFKETKNGIIINKYNGSDVDIIIPDTINDKNVIEIGEEAFGESDINSVKLPSNIKIIGKGAFTENSLESISLPDSLVKIKDKAFKRNKLKHITLPNNLIEIGEKAFHRNEIENVEIPKRVKEIGEEAFTRVDATDKVTVEGYERTAAETYATNDHEMKKGIKFKCLDCEKDESVSLKMKKDDLGFTTNLDKEGNLKFSDKDFDYEIEFGKDLESEFTIQYTIDKFIHTDGENTLEPIDESKFYKPQTANIIDTSQVKIVNDTKIVNGTITLDFLTFDNSIFVKKGNYNSKITIKVLSKPSS